jgi:hypothetical protein
VSATDYTRPISQRLGSTMAHTFQERLAYLMSLARVYVASPGDQCEPHEEGGMLYGALVLACERLGYEPQTLIDAAREDARALEAAP